jgi:hypothetical protein
LLSDELRSRAALHGVRALLPKENSFDELVPLLQRLLAEPSAGRADEADQRL